MPGQCRCAQIQCVIHTPTPGRHARSIEQEAPPPPHIDMCAYSHKHNPCPTMCMHSAVEAQDAARLNAQNSREKHRYLWQQSGSACQFKIFSERSGRHYLGSHDQGLTTADLRRSLSISHQKRSILHFHVLDVSNEKFGNRMNGILVFFLEQ